MNPRRFDSSAKGMCFLPREFQSPHENQGAEMFRNVVGIAVRDTRGLPAQEAALRIRAEPIDAVEVNAPLGPCCHLFLAHRMQRHTSAGIPGMILFVDSALPLPAGIPVGVINVAVTVDRQIDPISRWCDLELAINIDRKSTRLNSSHPSISYAVFCLKKKKKKKKKQN